MIHSFFATLTAKYFFFLSETKLLYFCAENPVVEKNVDERMIMKFDYKRSNVLKILKHVYFISLVHRRVYSTQM